MTKIIPITDPDYGPNSDYEFGLRIQDYGSGITDTDYGYESEV